MDAHDLIFPRGDKILLEGIIKLSQTVSLMILIKL